MTNRFLPTVLAFLLALGFLFIPVGIKALPSLSTLYAAPAAQPLPTPIPTQESQIPSSQNVSVDVQASLLTSATPFVSYTLVFTNPTDQLLQGVVLSSTLPPSTTLLTETNSQLTYNSAANALYWNIGTVLSDTVLSTTYVIGPDTTLTNTHLVASVIANGSAMTESVGGWDVVAYGTPPSNTTWITPEGGVLGVPDLPVQVVVPQGALTDALRFEIAPSSMTTPTTPTLWGHFDLHAYTRNQSPVTTFPTSVTVAVNLNPIWEDVLAASGTPGLYWYNEASTIWEKVPAHMNWASGYVSAPLDHFSTFGFGPTPNGSYGIQHLPTIHRFSTDEWSGNSTVQYPFMLPPAPGNMSFGLALSYSSEGVNSLLGREESSINDTIDEYKRQSSIVGWGWTLAGLGSVVHDNNANKAYLSFPGGSFELYNPPEITDTLPARRWQTDPQNFLQIHSTDSAGDQADARKATMWEVRTQDGMIYTFGDDDMEGNGVTYNREVSPAGGCSAGFDKEVRDTHLTRLEDAFGNYITIHYSKENDPDWDNGCGTGDLNYIRSIQPQTITYYAAYVGLIPAQPTARIVLDYTDRDDTAIENASNDSVQALYHTERLEYIRTYLYNGTGWDPARQYRLEVDYVDFPNYTDPNAAIMVLEAIRDDGTEWTTGTPLPDTSFTYTLFDNDWANTTLLAQANNGQGGRVTYGYTQINEFPIWGCNVDNLGSEGEQEYTYRYYVNRQRTYDGINNDPTVAITYTSDLPYAHALQPKQKGGNPDCSIEFEFGGYGYVKREVWGSIGTAQIVENYYHRTASGINGVAPYAGKLYRSDTRAPNNTILSTAVITWQNDSAYYTPWVYKSAEASIIPNEDALDGFAPADVVHGISYTYDITAQDGNQFGRVTRIEEFQGYPLSSATPYRTRETSYIRSGTPYLMVPERETVWDGEVTSPSLATCVQETRYAYDGGSYGTTPTLGRVTTQWVAYNVCASPSTTPSSLVDNWLVTHSTYDGWGNLIQTTDPRGGVSDYTYDTNSGGLYALLETSQSPTITIGTTPGRLTSDLEWDKTIGQVLTATESNGNSTLYEYDEYGRATKIWQPGDSGTPTQAFVYENYATTPALAPYRVTTIQRTSITGTTAITLPTWTYFDGLGREVQAWNLYYDPDLGQISTLNLQQYHPLGSVQVAFAPLSPSPATASVSFVPPTNSLWSSANAYSTTTNYDALARPVHVRATDATTMTYRYGAVEVGGINYLRNAVVDANHHRRVGLTDALGRTALILEYTGNCTDSELWEEPGYDCNGTYDIQWERFATTTYGFDVLDRLILVTDTLGYTTSMTYDRAGRKLGMSDPDMGTWEYRYDDAGNLLKQVDPNQNGICFTYDALNRVTLKRTYNSISAISSFTCPGTGIIASIGYSYDAGSNGKGRRTGMSDPTGSATWTYDRRGRVVTDTKSIVFGADTYTFTSAYTYDSADRVRTIRYPDDADGNPGELVTYAYTDGHQMLLRGVSGADPYIAGIEYNRYGQILQQVYGTTDAVTQTYTYWALDHLYGQGRLRGMSALRDGDTAPLLAFQYATAWDNSIAGYDAVGNVENIMERRWSGPSTYIDQRQEFFYDDLDRLTSAQVFNIGGGGSGTGILAREVYTYNEVGNLTARYVHDGQADPQTTYNYTTPQMAECPGTADATPKAHAVYSTSGRMERSHCYDAAGNLVHRVHTDTTTISQTLVYDEENRLHYLYNDPDAYAPIASFAYDGDGNRVRATMGGITTLYVGRHVEYTIEAALPSNTETLISYYMSGSQRVAMREQVVGGTNTLYYLLSDHLGSTSATLNEDGIKIADERYAAWGTSRWSPGDTPTRRLYTGQIEDVETGLYFYNARYYDPTLARFIQADTIVPNPNNPQSLNRYSYTFNNPVKYTDPSGHDVMLVSGWGTDGEYLDPADWEAWIRYYKGWETEEGFALWKEWYTSWTQADEAGKIALMQSSGIHIFDWRTCNCAAGIFDNSQNATIAWAVEELDRQLAGMEDITIIGHSKGGNAVLTYLKDPRFNRNIKNAILLDIPTRKSPIVGWLSGSKLLLNPDVPSNGPNVVNVYHQYDPVNNFGGGAIEGAINHRDTTSYWDPREWHNKKHNYAMVALTVNLNIVGDANARTR
jgi:RHS repeat-associated protein